MRGFVLCVDIEQVESRSVLRLVGEKLGKSFQFAFDCFCAEIQFFLKIPVKSEMESFISR
jgi:hypothetical protein